MSHQRPSWNRRAAAAPAAAALLLATSAAATAPAATPAGPLYTPAPSFAANDKVVSATVFHWFGSTDGQQLGPWRPLEGRPAWDGSVDFFKRQIKDIMDANIRVMYVHLMADPAHEQKRVNLFQAAAELRTQGYNVPKVAPFFDVPLTFIPQFGYTSPVDLNTAAGKDTFVNQYKRFFTQYWSVNTDPYADDYVAKIDNKPVLDVWHLLPENVANRTSLTRADVESRLKSAFGAAHPMFNNGTYQVATALNPNIQMPYADERIPQFETNEYLRTYRPDVLTPRTAQIKAGYWDQNLPDRQPGSILKRNGGAGYAGAWDTANATSNLRRINVESWNEYDEGSGIYEANPGPPYISPYNGSGNTDTWSSTNNPREYIDRTAAGARVFTGTGDDRDASILYQDFPAKMYAGTTRNVSVVVRNEGDNQWTAAQGYKLGQKEIVPGETVFGAGRFLLDDTKDEIPKYGGIFRGRPKQFDINIAAPAAAATYATHWQMLQENVAWFGAVHTATIQVLPKVNGDVDVDGDVDAADLAALADHWRTYAGADWVMGDLDSDHDVDRGDFNLLAASYPGGPAAARAAFQQLLPHWAADRSGDWAVAANWSNGVRSGVDATALFGAATPSARTVYADTAVTLGTMTFDSPNGYVVTGAASLTLQTSAGGAALVEVLQGTHKINLPVVVASDAELNVSGGATLLLSDPVTVSAGKTLTKTGGGTLTYESTVTLGAGATLAVAGADAGTLSVGGFALADGSKVDVGSGAVLIRDGDSRAVTTAVARGRHGGDWHGAGFTSSRAADDAALATAVGMRSDAGGVLVKFAYYGDTDLDGAVDLADFGRFVTGYRSPEDASWLGGDFDYSGNVDASDLALFVRGLVHQPTPHLTPALVGAIADFVRAEHLDFDTTSVPEPAAAGLLSRRRRRPRRRRLSSPSPCPPR